MTSEQAAWLAGIIEGEGSMYSVNQGAGWLIQVKMTDVDVVETCRRITGVGTVIYYPPRSGAPKAGAIWRVARRADREWIMAQVEPWLHQRRRARFRQLQEQMAERHAARQPVDLVL